VRTDDLISALAADGRARRDIGKTFAVALLAGALVAGAAFFSTLGFRPDIDSAMRTMRFPFKFVVTLSLAIAAIAVVLRIGRPGVPMTVPGWALIVAPLLLIAAVIIEMMVMPESTWMPRMAGKNALHCLSVIPLLSVPTLAGLIYVMRQTAPAHPALAGAMAGLASAGIAATYYASNCTDDSPLFVATWYTLAVAIVALVGAAAGSRWLRW
jgi:hypothetical protein